MNAVLAGVLAYVAVQLAVGVLVSRRVATEADYLVAGRRLGYGLGIATTFATWFGAETCIGSAGAVYESGIAGATADPFAYTICLLLMGAVLAGPLRRRNLTTLADLFRERFSPRVEALAVLIIAPSSLLWAAAQIRAFGQVLSVSSSLAVHVTIAISTAVVIAYTVSGGLLADAVTDLVQGVALIIGLVVLLVGITAASGGAGAALARVEPERLRFFFTRFGGGPLDVAEAWAVPIGGSVVAQELVSRVVAIRTPPMARRCCFAAGGVYLAVGLIPVFVGLAAVRLLPGLHDADQVLPRVARAYLPTGLYILFAGALVSAILSTVDSALLAASGLVVHNLIVARRPDMPERRKLLVNRAGVLAFGLVAWAIAVSSDSVFGLVEQASAFGGAGVLVIVFAGLFTRFGGARAALACLVAGLVVWLAAEAAHARAPFLLSLAASLLAYAIAAAFERRRITE